MIKMMFGGLPWVKWSSMRRGLATRSLLIAALILAVQSFAVEKRKLPGIWRLVSNSLPYEQDIRSKLKGLLPEEYKEEILIKLNPDGTFKQCNEGCKEGSWISGRWKLSDEKRLILAMNRQYYGPQFDVLLEGRIAQDEQLTVQGQVQKGKFKYPKQHPSFFDQPLANQESLGLFTLEQYLSTYTLMPTIEDVEEKPVSDNQFQPSDFYDRSFIMTIEPVQPKEKRKDDGEPLNQPVDIRAVPIQFFRNNTFQAFATNKIMRGRFRITKDQLLAFDVSLFGAGRSVSGSIFSEGIGLSHEDKRSYFGSIRESQGRLFVDGTVTFGSDMGSDARPEPVGTFLLTETKDDLPPIDEREDSSFDNVFQ
jgi:hypothetical protein